MSCSSNCTGPLKDGVVTTKVTDSSGAMTITFSPPLTSTGNYANVDALPVDDAAIIVIGSSITTGSGAMTATATRQGLVYHPDAFVVGMVDPDEDLPGADCAMVSDAETGWSMRYARQWNGQTDQKISRLDCFYGWLAYRPEWAVAVQGGAS